MTMFLLTEYIIFDVYLTLASWSGQPLKNIRLLYMEIGILILKGIENMNITSKDSYHQLAPDLKICRIANGMWQVAGGHGYIDHELAIEDMILLNFIEKLSIKDRNIRCIKQGSQEFTFVGPTICYSIIH